jgi:hypothetical protein
VVLFLIRIVSFKPNGRIASRQGKARPHHGRRHDAVKKIG